MLGDFLFFTQYPCGFLIEFELIVGGFNHHAPVGLAIPFQIQRVPPMSGKRLFGGVELHQFLHRAIRDLDGAQVGFPAWPDAIQQSPDHIFAEEHDKVAGDAAFQVGCCSAP